MPEGREASGGHTTPANAALAPSKRAGMNWKKHEKHENA